VPNILFNVVDSSVARFYLQCTGLSGDSLDKNLHHASIDSSESEYILLWGISDEGGKKIIDNYKV